jgi:hypothetical protein
MNVKNFSVFNKILIGSGVINTLLFNYNIHNVDIIRNDKKTKLLATERLKYSLLAFTIGWLKIPIFIDYINVKMLKENPKDYDLIEFPKKEIKYYEIFKYI